MGGIPSAGGTGECVPCATDEHVDPQRCSVLELSNLYTFPLGFINAFALGFK